MGSEMCIRDRDGDVLEGIGNMKLIHVHGETVGRVLNLKERRVCLDPGFSQCSTYRDTELYIFYQMNCRLVT